MNTPPGQDPVTTAIEKGIDAAAETAQRYLDPLLAPGAAEGGGIVRDTIASWRFKNQVRIVLNMKRFLEERGLSPKRLLPKTAYAILEAGSLETDPDMQQRWAALLASAAVNPGMIPPAYPKILGEMAPLEARLLDWLLDHSPFKDETNPADPFGGAPATTFQTALDSHRVEYSVLHLALTNLDRLNLIVASERLVTMTPTDETFFMHLRLTAFGASFVRACRPDCLVGDK